MRATVTHAMCLLSRSPLYGLLASEDGISVAENAWLNGIELGTSGLVLSWITPLVPVGL
jgi:hypothetical protein